MDKSPHNLHLMPAPADVVLRLWPAPSELAAVVKPAQAEELALNAFYASVVSASNGASTSLTRNLVHALAVHPENADPDKDRRWLRLAGALTDPENVNVPFAALCTKYRIRPGEIVPYFMDYQRSLAMFEIADRAPKLAAETMEDAMKKDGICGRCSGKGEVWEVVVDEATGEAVMVNDKQPKKQKVQCVYCTGSGRVVMVPSDDAREKALEMSGLIDRSKGPAVAIQNNYGLGPEDTVTDIGKILSGRG